MYKLKKTLYKGLLLALLASTGYSCSEEFLEEEQVTALSTSYFTTPDGIDDLITGAYQSFKFHFNYEWAYSTTNYGVDEFTVGGDRTMEMWNSYSANLNSLTGDAATIWDNMYGAISSCNIAIENIPLYYTGTAKNARLGEAYFIRAFNYFKLVKQFGGVPLKLVPSKTVELEFPRNTAQEVYDQIIKDFTLACNLLPTTPGTVGRITKWAAAHFLAKTYLYMASELNNDWNSSTKTADLQLAITYADSVITSGKHSLAANYSALWNFTKPDDANETLPEIILAAQFSNNTTTQGRYGNQIHLYYPSLYQNLAGLVRDISGGREFQRCRSTDYAVDVFDRVNDSRFWKSFKTVYLCNSPSAAPTWGTYAPTGKLPTDKKFVGGEQAILYIVNDAGDARYTSTNINSRAPHMFVRYFSGQAKDYMGNHGNYATTRFVALSKFCDGSRNAVASQFGQRDGILARLAETYLIAAEAYGRLDNYAAALPYLNKVRDRAAYVNGEDRTVHVDGGAAWKTNTIANTATFASYSDKCTYYESNNNMAVTTASSLSAMHLNSEADIFNSTRDFYNVLGSTSNSDKFLQFILNERSRELMGELMRWEDLSRTKTLVQRATLFNNEAKPVDPKHYLRPIPQSFLELIQTNGAPLTADQKQAMQNPGW